MDRISEDLIFRTADLSLAAYLLTRGLKLWATDSRDPGRVLFLLTPRPQPDDLMALADGSAQVNPGDFWRALKKLKAALYRAQDASR